MTQRDIFLRNTIEYLCSKDYYHILNIKLRTKEGDIITVFNYNTQRLYDIVIEKRMQGDYQSYIKTTYTNKYLALVTLTPTEDCFPLLAAMYDL